VYQSEAAMKLLPFGVAPPSRIASENKNFKIIDNEPLLFEDQVHAKICHHSVPYHECKKHHKSHKLPFQGHVPCATDT